MALADGGVLSTGATLAVTVRRLQQKTTALEPIALETAKLRSPAPKLRSPPPGEAAGASPPSPSVQRRSLTLGVQRFFSNTNKQP